MDHQITLPLKGYLLPNGLSHMPRLNGGAPASDHCASFQAHLAASASAPGVVGLGKGPIPGGKLVVTFFFEVMIDRYYIYISYIYIYNFF